MSKRLRDDPCDACFAEILPTLMERSIERWPAEQRSKLANMISTYLQNPQSFEMQEQKDEALPASMCSSTTPAASKGNTFLKGGQRLRENLWEKLDRTREFLKGKISFGDVQDSRFQCPEVSRQFITAKGGKLDDTGAVKENESRGNTGSCIAVPSFDVDAFLYSEADVEQLCDERKLSRHYCETCGSTKIGDCQFVSNSFSAMQLCFIFTSLFPACLSFSSSPELIVDVGSRLGITLVAAATATKCHSIIGVEISEKFCKVQNALIKKMGLGQASIRQCDILSDEGLHLLEKANIIFLNNVFEWFLPMKEQWSAWEKIAAHTTSAGSSTPKYLITYPSLLDTISPLAELELEEGRKGSSSPQSAEKYAKSKLLSSWVEEVEPPLNLHESFATEMGIMRTRGPNAEEEESSSECASEAAHEMELLKGIHVYKCLQVKKAPVA